MRAACFFYKRVAERCIPRAQDIGLAGNSRLQNGVVVRVPHHGSGRERYDQLTNALQEQKIPASAASAHEYEVSQNALDFSQDGREDERVWTGGHRQQQFTGKACRLGFGIRTDQDIRIENNPHGFQKRRGRTAVSASSSAASI